MAPGTELNGIQSHEDLFTTLAAAWGATDIKERLAKGDDLGTGVVKKNYIDGIDNTDYWTGKSDHSNRNHFIYYAEDHLQAIRLNQWKLHFSTRDGYYGNTTHLDVPSVFNIRQDPFESYDQAPGPRALTTQGHTYVGYQIQDIIEAHVKSLVEFPPVQRGTSLSMDVQMQQMTRTKQ